jgi:hypothetical protein
VAGKKFFAEQTVWERTSHPLPPQKLSGNISTEVLIIGAGTTGSLVAQALAADGRRVSVL